MCIIAQPEPQNVFTVWIMENCPNCKEIIEGLKLFGRVHVAKLEDLKAATADVCGSDEGRGLMVQLAMQQTDVFPNMVIQMAAIGEEAGSLDSMLVKSCRRPLRTNPRASR